MADERTMLEQIKYLVRGFLNGGYLELLFVFGVILFGFGIFLFLPTVLGNFPPFDEKVFFLMLIKFCIVAGFILIATSYLIFYSISYFRIRKKRKLKQHSS